MSDLLTSERNTERRRIIQRLIKKLTSGDFVGLTEDYITTASKYTGLHPMVLKELESCDVYETKLEPVDRSVIYAKLVDFYKNKKKIPCTYELFSALYGEIPPYIDIGNFRKILVKMDFVWKKVSASTAVVIENPLVRFERYNYLKKIQFHRAAETDIYYIDTNSYDLKGTYRDFKLTKEHISQPILDNNWLQRVIYAIGLGGIHAFEELDTFSTDVVEDWVRDTLLPKITRPSVFILKNSELHNGKLIEKPTLDSLKSDTIRWLDRHGVTYDPKMSKYELFALAEKFTNLNMDLFKIDEMLKVNGHSVLRIPRCIENVTSAALLYRVINDTLSEAITDSRVLENGNKSDLKMLFRDLIANAAAMYIEDFEKHITDTEAQLVVIEDEVDEVYDSLMAKAGSVKQKEANEDSDLPSCSDSE